MTAKQTYYRCDWATNYRGVYVEVKAIPADECPDGYHATREAAREECARRMRHLASDLMRQASFLSEDPRGR